LLLPALCFAPCRFHGHRQKALCARSARTGARRIAWGMPILSLGDEPVFTIAEEAPPTTPPLSALQKLGPTFPPSPELTPLPPARIHSGSLPPQLESEFDRILDETKAQLLIAARRNAAGHAILEGGQIDDAAHRGLPHVRRFFSDPASGKQSGCADQVHERTTAMPRKRSPLGSVPAPAPVCRSSSQRDVLARTVRSSRHLRTEGAFTVQVTAEPHLYDVRPPSRFSSGEGAKIDEGLVTSQAESHTDSCPPSPLPCYAATSAGGFDRAVSPGGIDRPISVSFDREISAGFDRSVSAGNRTPRQVGIVSRPCSNKCTEGPRVSVTSVATSNDPHVGGGLTQRPKATNDHRPSVGSIVTRGTRRVSCISSDKSWLRHRPSLTRHSRRESTDTTAAADTTKLLQIWSEAHKSRCLEKVPSSESLSPPTRSWSVAKIVSNIKESSARTNLEVVMGFVIVVNAIIVGLSSEWKRDWFGWAIIDAAFAAIFTLELLLKWCQIGIRKFFFGEGWMTNSLDFILVVLALVEVAVWLVGFYTETDTASSAFVFSAMRVIRLLRIARIFRMARLPMFQELLMMLEGARGGIRALLWSQVLVALFLYVVALVFREMVGSDHVPGASPYFDTLPESFFTSFRCLIANDCTDAMGRPIFLTIAESYGWHVAFIYCLACVLMTFGLFNVIVAIYVENTVAAAKYNELRRKQQRLMDKERFHEKALVLVNFIVRFCSLQSEAPRTVHNMTYSELKTISLTPELFESLRVRSEFREILRDLDIADEEQLDLFDTLDVDGGGTIDLEELVQGIWKLRGDARRSDIVSVGLILRNLQVAVQNLQNSDYYGHGHQSSLNTPMTPAAQ